LYNFNGQGIYATRARNTWKEGEQIRFTTTKDKKYTYAFTMVWPGTQLMLTSVKPKENSDIYLLGYDKPLHWIYKEKKLLIFLPQTLQSAALRPCQSAWAFK